MGAHFGLKKKKAKGKKKEEKEPEHPEPSPEPTDEEEVQEFLDVDSPDPDWTREQMEGWIDDNEFDKIDYKDKKKYPNKPSLYKAMKKAFNAL